MLGVLFFLFSVTTGLCVVTLAIPEAFTFTSRTYDDHPLSAPSFIFVLPASVLVGTIISGWFTYILAYLFSNTGDGLKYAEPFYFLSASVLIVFTAVKHKSKLKNYLRSLRANTSSIDIALLIITIFFSSFIDIYSFYYKDNAYFIGKDVSEDFTVHLEIIRSISHGNNFPTQYPLFAGTDMRYHFMFQFYTAILEHLGLRLDIAFNLTSIVFLVSVFCLLYTLALKLFGKKTIGILAVIFAMFRSSNAFIKYLFELVRDGKPVFYSLTHNMKYIGYTLNESWGIYGINTFANQRHLAIGICSLLFAVISFLPNFKPTFKLFSKEAWLPKNYKASIFIGVILGLTGFYNGACVIGCLVILFILALFSTHKIDYSITAIVTYILVSLQANFFATDSIVSFRFAPGYLAYNEPGYEEYNMNVLFFLILLLGISFLLVLISLLINKGKYRYILLSFISPLVFAFLFKLTIETETNHKYIIITCMLCDIFIAALLTDPKVLDLKKAYSKVLFAILIFLMTCTGVFDLITFVNSNAVSNDGKVFFSDNDPVTNWILENADSSDTFLTYEYQLTRETIAGPMLFYGDSYPAWGAGYDVYGRLDTVISIFESADSKTLNDLCTDNGIRYIIIDENVRDCPDYDVREDIIAQTYECVFSYEDENGVENIYDTSKLVARIS